MSPKWATEDQIRLIRELGAEAGSQIYEMPKTQHEASKLIDRLFGDKYRRTRKYDR
jgi:hypothetical protein